MDRGIFGLGNPRADELALQWAVRHALDDADGIRARAAGGVLPKVGGAVVVFGSGIDALAAIGGLIKSGIPASLISLATPEIEFKDLGHSTVGNSKSINFYCTHTNHD